MNEKIAQSVPMSSDSESSSGIKRSWSFDPTIFSAFKKAVEAIGASPQSFIRKTMQDVIDKRHLNFDLFDSDVRDALQKKAIATGTEQMQTVVATALREWLARQTMKRK